MMVNTVPSYCVSLDILLSEYSLHANGTGKQKPDCVSEPSNNLPRKKSSNSLALMNRQRNKSSKAITEEMEDLISTKEFHDLGQHLYDLERDHRVVLPRRWLALAIYCCVSFMQVVVWNTWSPIASAALYAFPSWTPGTVALFSNWGCVCFVFLLIPTSWLLNEKGLKFACLLGSCLCTIGSGIRCFLYNEDQFTICAHIGAFFNSVGGVILAPSAILLSSTWFPAHQRATATGAGTAISALGMAGSYLISPSMISLPTPDYPLASQKEVVRQQIQKLMFLDFALHFKLFWVVLLCFPQKPTIAPSHSSNLSLSYKRSFKRSIKKLLRNRDIWLLGLSAAMSSGMTGPWLSQLTILFSHRNLSPTELARLGFWTIISSCLFSLTATRFSDMFQGHIKAILFGLVAFATVMFICILNIINSSDSAANKDYLIQAIIAGFSASWASSPLFYELGAEIAYPVPEGIVASYIMFMSSLSCAIVYAVFYMISNTGLLWLNYGLVGYNIAALIFLFLVNEQYNRLSIDT